MNNPASAVKRNIIFLTAFSIAMGFMEAVVVVYLRQLYYPGGFEFPLRPALQGLSLEYLREISTVVMLVAVSMAAGRSTYDRFSYFLYCFGIWDIFYYVWLKALLDWPQSLLTWDVLFLIPVVWVGPVAAPIICAATMVTYAGFILHFLSKGRPVKITLPAWGTMTLGIFSVFITFIGDFTKIIIREGFLLKLSSLAEDPHFYEAMAGYIPTAYNWALFVLGEGLILCSLAIFLKRMKSSRYTRR